MNFRISLIIILVMLIAASCIQENPDLVNPPDKTASIKFRFFNLSLDKNQKQFEVTDGGKTPYIDWGRISSTFNPPADTGFIRTLSNNNIEFQQELLVRFLRNTNYTYVGLSSTVCDDRSSCKIDTLIAIRTTAAIPENNFEALLKFMNAFPDTNVRFSVRLGCPSGEALFGFTNYKQYSISPITVRSGEFNFSVIKTEFINGVQENTYLNLYTANFDPRGQYLIITHEDSNGDVQVSIIDENDDTENSLRPAQIVPLRTTEVRAINMTSSQVSINMRDGTPIDDNISPLSIDDYMTIEACKSSALDSIDINANNTLKSSIYSSLEVLSKYSIIVFDSADVKTGASLLVHPLKLNVAVDGKAVVRVVNTIEGFDGLNVSIGARKEENRQLHPNGYAAGIALARRLQFGEISNPAVIDPGPAPLSVFTASEPSRLLIAANSYLEADKSYLLIISKDELGQIQISIIEENDQNKNVEYLKKGVFFQLVNAMSDNSSLSISLNSSTTGKEVLNNADLQITNSLATVIESGSQSITINGKNIDISAEESDRVMIVAAGDKDNLQAIQNKFQPLTSEQNGIFRIRFVNATVDIPITMLKKTDNDSVFVESVEINSFSSYTVETREQKPTYFFYEGDTPGYLARFSDVTLSLGKSFCVIIYGSSSRDCVKKYEVDWKIAPTCYSLIIQQEF